MDDAFERIENLGLIENALAHLEFEMQRDSPSFFRVAREAHQVLYRSMVEVLRGSDCFDVLAPKLKHAKHACKYRFANSVWMEVIKEEVPGCQAAWRFSAPHSCAPPDEILKEETEQGHSNEELSKEFDEYWQQDLIAFYPALAKIQTEYFMHRYCDSKWARIDDEDMQLLEWVHERVRNEFEHFVPKLYCVARRTSLCGAVLCLRIAKQLLLDSNNVIFLSREQRDQVQSTLVHILANFQQWDGLHQEDIGGI